jgi:hypothetical protein
MMRVVFNRMTRMMPKEFNRLLHPMADHAIRRLTANQLQYRLENFWHRLFSCAYPEADLSSGKGDGPEQALARTLGDVILRGW